MARPDTAIGAAGAEVIDRLMAEERRLALDAKLAWIEYARRELKALMDKHSVGSAMTRATEGQTIGD